MEKIFTCINFNPTAAIPCPYSVTGEEDWVIQQATDHVVNEHNNENTPELRQEIKASLVDVTPVDPTGV